MLTNAYREVRGKWMKARLLVVHSNRARSNGLTLERRKFQIAT